MLIKEQPLLLEELLEQEKREQEKQLQNQSNSSQEEPSSTGGPETESALLSDHDFEKLKVDVFSSGQLGGLGQTASQGMHYIYFGILVIFILINYECGKQNTIYTSDCSIFFYLCL